MSGRAIYQQLCQAADPGRAVETLTAAELAEVAAHLATLPRGGIPSQVFGLVSARLDAPAEGWPQPHLVTR